IFISVHDSEMRHERNGAGKRFNGHKAAVAVEMESQLISAVEVLAGNAGDQEKALELVQQSERVLEAKVEETVGDCAYGGGPTRRAFAEEERGFSLCFAQEASRAFASRSVGYLGSSADPPGFD